MERLRDRIILSEAKRQSSKADRAVRDLQGAWGRYNELTGEIWHPGRMVRHAPTVYLSSFQVEGGAVNSTFIPADHASSSAFIGGIQDFTSLEMNRTIGKKEVSNPSLASGSSSKSDVLDVPAKKASLFAPVEKLFKAAAHAVVSCMEMQRSWLARFAAHAMSRASTAASSSGNVPKPTPDDLAYSMDIALGERLTASSSRVIGSSRHPLASRSRINQSQPTQDDLAYGMDVAIGARYSFE